MQKHNKSDSVREQHECLSLQTVHTQRSCKLSTLREAPPKTIMALLGHLDITIENAFEKGRQGVKNSYKLTQAAQQPFSIFSTEIQLI